MLCIEVWSLDSTEHIEVSTTWVSPMLVWAEDEGNRIEVSAEFSLGIEVTCRNVSEEIEINATFTPEVEVWTSYVCSLHDGDFIEYLEILPQLLVFNSKGETKDCFVFSNTNWYITEKI